MGLVTVRPNSTPVDNNWDIQGGSASIHAALADDNDATYIDPNDDNDDEYVWEGFPDPTIPAGAVVKSYAVRVRSAQSGGSGTLYILAAAGATPTSTGVPPGASTLFSTSRNIYWSSPQTISAGSGSASSTPFVRLRADERDTLRAYALYLDATYVDQPTLNVVLPTGTITDTNTPTVQWERTLDGSGGGQTAFQVKFYDETTFGDFSGVDPDDDTPYLNSSIVSSSADTYTPTTPLAEDDYRAYVRVAQTVSGELHWSAWDTIDFTIDLPSPAAPDVTVTPQDDDARIRLELEANAGDVDTDRFQIQVLVNGEWVNLRVPSDQPGDGQVLNDAATVYAYDLDAGNGETRTYRVRAVATDGLTSYSGWVQEAGEWESASAFLKHASNPNLNVAVTIRSYPARSRKARRGVFQALGSDEATAVSDAARGASEGTLGLLVLDASNRNAIDELLATTDPVLIQCHPDWDEPDRWVSFGDHDRTRPTDRAHSRTRFDDMPWTEVGTPEADLELWPPE
jgi:hypothetical protein